MDSDSSPIGFNQLPPSTPPHGNESEHAGESSKGCVAHAHGVDNQLEVILKDAGTSFFDRLRIALPIELRLLTNLCAPAIVVYMLNYVMSMSTQIICGHLGNLELAAASIGNTGIQLFAYGLMVCIIYI